MKKNFGLNEFGLMKYFSDVKDKEIKEYLKHLIGRYGIVTVLNKTNGILNTELTIKMLKKAFDE